MKSIYRLYVLVNMLQVLKVWDLRDHVCLQTITVKFPISLHGKMPEHGPFAFHLQPAPQNALLITSNDYIAMLKLGSAGPPISLTPVTHQTQLCAAIYNPFFKQVCLNTVNNLIKELKNLAF